jgi:hypothetical protein
MAGEEGIGVFIRIRLPTNFRFSLIVLSLCHAILSQIRVLTYYYESRHYFTFR